MCRLLIAFFVLIVLQACGETMTMSRVGGTVRLGPIMPVCRVGVPCDGVYKDAPVTLRAVDGQVVRRGATDDKGEFLLSAPPGRYEVAVGVEGRLPNCTPKQVAVRVRETVRVEIDCDSGIR